MILSYFLAEKQGGFIAMAIGIAACAVGGGVLLSAGAPFYTGLSIPLVVIGIVQIMTGASVARRSDFQADDLEKLRADSPAEFRRLESSRMEVVLRNFVRIKWLEVVFIVLGFAILLLNQELNFTKGLGVGLLSQGVVMLLFDIFAEKRGRAYEEFVKNQ